jgi:hypothetical protein
MMHAGLPAVAATHVYFYTSAVDMRRSFNGLMAIVQTEFERDILAGDLFVFLNKRRDRIKALWWDGDVENNGREQRRTTGHGEQRDMGEQRQENNGTGNVIVAGGRIS